MGRSGGRDKPGGATPDWLGPRDPGDGPAPANRPEAREEQKAEKKRRPKRDLDDDLDDGPSKAWDLQYREQFASDPAPVSETVPAAGPALSPWAVFSSIDDSAKARKLVSK